MPVKKRKAGATKKRKTKVGSVAATKIKISGQNFTKSSCHSKKTEAKSRAEGVRSKGTRARVIKSGSTYCVYTGGVSKTLKRRAARG